MKDENFSFVGSFYFILPPSSFILALRRSGSTSCWATALRSAWVEHLRFCALQEENAPRLLQMLRYQLGHLKHVHCRFAVEHTF